MLKVQERVLLSLSLAEQPLTIAKIADDTGLDSRQVRDALRRLEKHGHVSRGSTPGKAKKVAVSAWNIRTNIAAREVC